MKSSIALALILLLGTGLFLWKAGFFDDRSKIKTSEQFIECVDIITDEAYYQRTWAEQFCFNLMR